MAGNDLCSTHFSVHNSYIFVIAIQFLFCFLRTRKAIYIRIFCSFVHKFPILFSDLVAMPQIWPRATGFAAMPQIWPLCHRFDRRVTILAAVPQIGPPCNRVNRFVWLCNQGIGIKGREMTLVWHEKASRTALQTSSV